MAAEITEELGTLVKSGKNDNVFPMYLESRKMSTFLRHDTAVKNNAS